MTFGRDARKRSSLEVELGHPVEILFASSCVGGINLVVVVGVFDVDLPRADPYNRTWGKHLDHEFLVASTVLAVDIVETLKLPNEHATLDHAEVELICTTGRCQFRTWKFAEGVKIDAIYGPDGEVE